MLIFNSYYVYYKYSYEIFCNTSRLNLINILIIITNLYTVNILIIVTYFNRLLIQYFLIFPIHS